MAPPELARDAPRLDVLHPAEELLAPALGHELHAAVARRRDRRLGELLGVGVPLLGQERLDRHAAAIAVGHGVGVRLDLVDAGPAASMSATIFLRASKRSRPRYFSGALSFSRANLSKMLMASSLWRRPTSKSLKSCAGVILTAPEPFSGSEYSSATIGIRRPTSGRIGVLADQVLPLGIVGMHRHAGVAQHRLGPRRGHHDVLVAALDRVFEVPEMAPHLARFDLEVGDRRQHLGVPVDQPVVLVDQAGLVEIDEHFQHGARQALVHGEALARPVARGAQPAQLAGDGAARIGLPLPDLGEELLAVQQLLVAVALLGALDGEADALLLEVAHHDHLRGDAGVIGAGLPQHVVALHAAPADQHVLQRVVERVAHVQAARDVGRRDDDAVRRLRRLRMGAERAALLPLRVEAGFDLLGVVGLVEHLLPYNEKRHGGGTVAFECGGRLGVSGGSAGRSRVRHSARPSAAGCGRATPSASAAASP